MDMLRKLGYYPIRADSPSAKTQQSAGVPLPGLPRRG